MPVLPAPEAPTHVLPGTRFTSLATPSRGTTETSVWLVEIDAGTAATPHEVTREEVFVVLDGRADVRLGDDERVVGAGETVVVPAGVLFAISPADGHHLRALCCAPAANQARIGEGEAFTPPWSL